MLELDRAKKAVSRMAPLGVVVVIDEAQKLTIGVASREEDHAVGELLLDRREEAFSGSVVKAVAFATHAGNKAMGMENLLIVLAHVLGSSIRMMNKPRGWLPCSD